jgi:signal transduction histidine kinase
VLSVSRAIGGTHFRDSELEMASEFASQTGLAIELTRARADRQRLMLVDERSRIARVLHDHVIQRLFGAGLGVQAVAAAHPATADALFTEANAIDAAIAEIRTVIFTLSQRTQAEDSLRHRLLDLVTELTPAVGSAPRLTFAGAVDLSIRGALADDVVAVVRESLSNVARHAQASSVEVEVAIHDNEVTVVVVDDGRGPDPATDRRSGLGNLGARARAHAGTFDLTARAQGGSRARWTARLDEDDG